MRDGEKSRMMNNSAAASSSPMKPKSVCIIPFFIYLLTKSRSSKDLSKSFSYLFCLMNRDLLHRIRITTVAGDRRDCHRSSVRGSTLPLEYPAGNLSVTIVTKTMIQNMIAVATAGMMIEDVNATPGRKIASTVRDRRSNHQCRVLLPNQRLRMTTRRAFLLG